MLFDAIYCITVGIGIMLAATYVAPIIGIPVLLTIAIGCATTVWGIGIVGMMRTIPLATALTTVMTVNIMSTIAVATFSATLAGVGVTFTVLAFALDIAAFAAKDGRSRGPRTPLKLRPALVRRAEAGPAPSV